jgi:betaine lipid synthase
MLVKIPSFYALLDRIDYVLSPEDGLVSVVDFYTSNKQSSLHEKAIGGAKKECGWLSRWFWQIWFDFDHVSLSPLRRNYLEYRFGTVSQSYPFFRIP